MLKLHLCSGFDYKSGFVNVDNVPGGPQDVTADLNARWDFAADASVSHILIQDGLEHLDSIEHFLEEASRVLVPGGIAEILVPHFRSPSAYRLTHRHFFSWSFFNVFPEAHDRVHDLRVLENELIVERSAPWNRVNVLANLAPKFWERLLYVSALHVVLEKLESASAGVSAKPDATRRSHSPLSTGSLEIIQNVSRHIPEGQSVLEVGCGNGHLSERIVARGNRLLGIDISASAIEECKRLLGDSARFETADVITYQTDERFDYAFINEVLDQVPDDKAALAAVFALLKPGGRLVLSTPVSPDRFPAVSLRAYDTEQIRSMLRAAGFEIELEDAYGGTLAHAAALASKKVRFPAPLLTLVRHLPLYRAAMAIDGRLGRKKDRLIAIARKPEAR